MKNRLTLLMMVVSLLGFSVLSATTTPSSSDIPTPQQRALVLQTAEKLLGPGHYDYPETPADLNNPFSPAEQGQDDDAGASKTKTLRPASDHDFLIILASQLNPTGTFMTGNGAILLFGQKKVKVGDKLSIVFDNQPYELEVLNIERTAFTLKFNNEELTRPIKPGKNP